MGTHHRHYNHHAYMIHETDSWPQTFYCQLLLLPLMGLETTKMRGPVSPCLKNSILDLAPTRRLLLGTSHPPAMEKSSIGNRSCKLRLLTRRAFASARDSAASLLDWDPFEDVLGPYTDSSRERFAASHLRSWYGPDGDLVSKFPCPTCRGRGYVVCPLCDLRTPEASCPECSGKGIKTCLQCLGKRSVLAKSVSEIPWGDTESSNSTLEVEDDKIIEHMDIQLSPKRNPNRVYGSHSVEVREKIRRALKALDARTGSVTRRMRRIHSDPVLRARRIAAIKKAKRTEAARKHMSEKLRLFFQNPENRYRHGLRLKGVVFHCSQCGEKGHRKHYCPNVPRKKQGTRVYRCGLCGQLGHKRTSCRSILKSSLQSASRKKLGYRCGFCKAVGHNVRSCPQRIKRDNCLDKGR